MGLYDLTSYTVYNAIFVMSYFNCLFAGAVDIGSLT